MKIFCFIAFVLLSVWFFWAMQGHVTSLWLIKACSIYKIGNCIIICTLILKDDSRECYPVFIKTAIKIFLFSFSVLMLYPWLPNAIKLIEVHSSNLTLPQLVQWIYFIIWGIAAPILLYLYVIYCRKN